MTAANLPLLIEQGATFKHALAIEDDNGPVILTGYTARMDIRPCPGSATLLHRLTTGNGGISINGPAGEITLTIPSAITATFTWGRAEYDLLLTAPDNADDRLIEGPVTVKAGVTR
ncbi:LtfC-like domain-containing protein [Streptosporangium roseum]|uniref:LtfC-like domain-containing protein n=1 Tax=Streptosporangium roseum TaxID=2001 RepID=UPI003317E7E4